MPEYAERFRAERFRECLLAWYDANRRDLPWRESSDFYRVWISEVMLQQTRVEAAIPHYLRFLERFPAVGVLAAASESDVLAAWSGLGYYSRARNLHRAARIVAASGTPDSFDAMRALPGAGPYTAAAVASIALGLPCAAVDGNVVRVASRLSNDASPSESPAVRRRFAELAERLLDRSRPGDFNQAMMELGATVCLPAGPRCAACPVEAFCAARAAGTQETLPARKPRAEVRQVALNLLLRVRIAPGGSREVFLVRRGGGESRLAGFWEPPSVEIPPDGARRIGVFKHQIVNDRFQVAVWLHPDPLVEPLPDGRWFAAPELSAVPLGGIARKAVASLEKAGDTPLFDIGQ